jgi:hypothetical protein
MSVGNHRRSRLPYTGWEQTEISYTCRCAQVSFSDFDVFKALTLRRPSEAVSYNDVLRDLLGLGPDSDPATLTDSQKGDWVVKGVRIPAGSEFRATYKGKTVLARVEQGALLVNGRSFNSPSAAAVSITGNPVNGWTFWECRLSGEGTWRMLKMLRK